MMTLEWSRTVPYAGPTHFYPHYAGFFWPRNDGVCFFYRESRQLAMLHQSAEQPTVFPVFPGSLPYDWQLFPQSTPPLLAFDEERAFDLSHLQLIDRLPDALQQHFIRSSHAQRHHLPAEFAPYTIEKKGEQGYLCRCGNDVVWTLQGRGYLYTDLVRSGNSICFGTAGHGGCFYLIDLASGNIVSCVKTGGTTKFLIIDSQAYFLSNEPRAHLLQLDLHTGEVVQRIPLPGIVRDTILQQVGDHLHAITYRFTRQGALAEVYWSCVHI